MQGLNHSDKVRNVCHALQDKNPFSGLTDEHLSRLEDVLSSEEVRNFLQQTSLSDLDTGLGGARLPDSGQLSDNSPKLDLFDNQASDSSLHVDQTLAHHFIQVSTSSVCVCVCVRAHMRLRV